jgi:hypothetical protein
MKTRIPVTDEIRAAAEALHAELDKHNHPIEVRWRIAGIQLKLRKIIAGQQKHIDTDWWRKIHNLESIDVDERKQAKHRATLAKVKAMTDPATNPNPHQRKVAEEMLAKLKAKAPAAQTSTAPGLEEHDRQQEERAKRGRAKQTEKARMMEALHRVNEAAWAQAREAIKKAKPVKHPPEDAVSSASTPKEEPMRAKAKPEAEKPKCKNTRKGDRHKPRSGDRHSAGYMKAYMRDYMRRRRAERKGKP